MKRPRPNGPTIVGGGIVCALGAHAPSVIAGIAAGLDGLTTLTTLTTLPVEASPPRRRVGIARDRLGSVTVGDPALSLLMDAIEYLLSTDAPRPQRYTAVFGVRRLVVPMTPLPSIAGAQAIDAVRRGAEAGLSEFVRSRMDGRGAKKLRLLTGSDAGGQAMTTAYSLLQHDTELDGCLVACADALTHETQPRSSERWRSPSFAIGDAAAAFWLLRRPPRDKHRLPRIVGVGTASPEHERGPAIRTAVSDALREATLPLGDVLYLVDDLAWNTYGVAERNVALNLIHARRWTGVCTSPAYSIGHVGVASGVVQTLLACHLAARHGRGNAALVLLSDLARPTAWLVEATAAGQPAPRETRSPWAW